MKSVNLHVVVMFFVWHYGHTGNLQNIHIAPFV